MKTISQIHQQTLDIIARLSHRRHVGSEAFEAILRIHNRYLDNICRYYGVAGIHRLNLKEQNTPLSIEIYASH